MIFNYIDSGNVYLDVGAHIVGMFKNQRRPISVTLTMEELRALLHMEEADPYPYHVIAALATKEQRNAYRETQARKAPEQSSQLEGYQGQETELRYASSRSIKLGG